MLALAMRAASAYSQTQPAAGEALFRSHCAGCHTEAAEARAPAPDVLRQRSPAAILEVLANGSMRVQGAGLNGLERRAIAEYLGGSVIAGDPTGAAGGRCPAGPPFKFASGPAWNGWGVTPANTRWQSAAQGGLKAEQLPLLELKWAFGFPDATSAWAQPSIVDGWLFVGSQNGTVYALDAKSGCIHWFFSADSGVRTAVTVGPAAGGAVYFGDIGAKAYALEAATGHLLWKVRVEEHALARITGAPTLYRDRVYVPMSSYEESQGARPEYGCCTFRGSVTALDAKSGKAVWKTYMIPDEPRQRGTSLIGVPLYGPAGAPIWSAATIDAKRDVLYVGTGNSYAGAAASASDAVVALSLTSGKIQWIKQLYPKDVFISGCRVKSENPNCVDQGGPDYDFGNSPILAKRAHGKSIIVIGQKSGIAWGLNPDKAGEVLWQYRAGAGGALGGIEWGSAVDAERAYFAVSDIFSPAPGGLHAVSISSGARIWYSAPPPPQCPPGPRCSAAQAAAISVIPGVVFSGSNDGVLRAYSARDGSVIWETNTEREFNTVNAVPARGASMLGPGPVIVAGMLYVSSGYGAFGGRPGNVLLAYGMQGK
jgi:polyvinyl alcohol dehydrogenase (cytochrome)